MALNKIHYQIFEKGVKGYLFQVDGIDLERAPDRVKRNYEKNFINTGEKFNVIGIPDEEIGLPDYYIVNWKKMLKFAWTDRVESFLKPLMELSTPKDEVTF